MKIQLMNVQRQHETYASEYEEAALRVLRSGRLLVEKRFLLLKKNLQHMRDLNSAFHAETERMQLYWHYEHLALVRVTRL